MSTDNIENTKPINKQIGDTQHAEVPAIDRTDLPVDSQAETRVIRKRAAKKQAGGDVSTAETIRITPPLDQPEEMNESPASVDEQAAEEPALASPDVPAEETAKQLPELPTAGSDVPTPPPPGGEPVESTVKVKRGKWIWLGILIMLVMILAGSGIGYASAMRARAIEQDNQRLILATTQFELGLVDQAQGKLEIAQDRFEYVLSIYPEFPGIDEKLVEVGLLIGQSQGGTFVPTPGPEPTPTVAITVVPTKTTGSTTLLFNQAKSQLEGQDWEGLYSTLNAMREIDPAYKAVEVDGMWYITLRYRGISLIQGGQLEPGLYSFALAEQFAPIDADAESYRSWARMYLNAGAYWEVDWYKAVEGFAYLYPLVPQLRDSSGITVTMRYSRALAGYGDYLQQNYDFCGAAASYSQAASIYQDPALEDKITQAEEYCANPPPTPTPTVDPLAPTATPTPEP